MSSSDPGASRPLSPHLSVYRFHLSMALSILHRAAGMALTGVLVLFIVWLWAAAYSGECFDAINGLLRTPVGLVLLIGVSLVFNFKFVTGLRHLWWDTGAGFAVPSIDKSGRLVLLLTVVLTLIVWAFVYCTYFQE